MRSTFTLLLILFVIRLSQAQQILPSSELKNYHPITIAFTDSDESYSETANPNPFLDRRLNVTFTSPSSASYLVPGYFAADGETSESGASSGNIWHVKFTPNEVGTWSYTVSFREGEKVAIADPQSSIDGLANAPIDGQSGTFTIGESDKSGVDFRGKGKLSYVGEHFMKWSGTGEYFLEFGANSPEVFLEYQEFDNTSSTRTYPVHVSDWNSGDPTWNNGAYGKGIIGVVNYLSEQGMNVNYFLTMNIKGDGKKAYPYVADDNFNVFDVSKLAQWGIVFDHMMEKGVMPEFVLTENENQSIWESEEGVLGGFADGRKLYYREMVARFGYLNAIAWNIGEEIAWDNGTEVGTPLTDQQQYEFAEYLKQLLPNKDQMITIHNGPDTNDDVFQSNLGDDGYSAISYQGDYSSKSYGHDRILNWVTESTNRGKPWVVRYAEPYVGSSTNDDTWRKNSLWAALTAGGAGVQYYDGGGRDLTTEDYTTYAVPFSTMYTAYNFFHTNDVPFWEMSNNDAGTSLGWMLSKTDENHVIYLPDGGSPDVNLGNSGVYSIKWYDPRNGGDLKDGSITTVNANGSPQNLGAAPDNGSSDWLIYAFSDTSDCTSDYEEVDGLVVIEAENLSLPTGWNVENTTTGFTGSGYISWAGGESFSSPGQGVITTKIKINAAGTYLLQWRTRIGEGNNIIANNDNDAWVRFNDASEFYAKQGNRIIYPQGSGQTPVANGSGGDNWFNLYTYFGFWNWLTITNEYSPYAIYVDFDAPGIYTMEISARSENYSIDRIVLSANGNRDLELEETLCGGNIDNQAPVAVASATPLSGEAPLEVSFTGSESTDDVEVTAYYWDFGDGNTDTTANPVHVYNSEGSYTATLTVSDAEGLQDTQELTIEVISNLPADLVATPDTLDFGTRNIDDSASQLDLELFNNGENGDDISISAISITGTDAVLFSYSEVLPLNVMAQTMEIVTISFTPDNSAGAKSASLEITHSGGNSPIVIPLSAVLVDGSGESTPLVRISAAGSVNVSATDQGPDWESNPDDGFYVGSSYSVNTGKNNYASLNYADRHSSIPDYIDSATFSGIFKNERTDDSSGEEMEYVIPLENGNYTVNLYMGNSWSGSSEPGERVFDILIEGKMVEEGMDLSATFGHRVAGMKSYQVVVTDELLNIEFDHEVDNPLINAIEVLSEVMTGNQAPVAVASATPLTGEVPLEVSFTGSESTDDVEVTAYYWDFGDGNTDTTANPVHSYDSEGSYTATLTVNDAEGLQDTQELTIEVISNLPADLVATPDALDFGTLNINDSVSQLDLELFNSGENGDDISISAISITGTDAVLFSYSEVLPLNVMAQTMEIVTISFTPDNNAGAKSASLEITHSGGDSPIVIPLSAVLVDGSGESTPLVRINAAGSVNVSATDQGPDWESNPEDGFYVGNSYSVNTGKNNYASLNYADRHSSIPDYIDSATFSGIFKNERTDDSSGEEMEYVIPLENGNYTVNLYMGNSWSGSSEPGERVFDILIEGKMVEQGMDLSATFGHRVAGMNSYQVVVTDGMLNIGFAHEVDNPLVNAIEIIGDSNSSISKSTHDIKKDSALDLTSSLVPNPADGFTQLIFNNASSNVENILIYSTNGQLIKSINNPIINDYKYVINVNELEEGLYFINIITSEDKLITKKLMIKH
ncbi:malectin domain-containing carbohydrate-binding protein [Pseudotamlana agarivorans]|uniref:malectin domain-containing carbohydrate-binding protein n=1 Tax=Pseudotamlana agarivorans TaxID=481183 RepID=UPI00082D2D29|nr:malectin domain-containing carbohydrate-binding protein [Tamlana agarivorans]